MAQFTLEIFHFSNYIQNQETVRLQKSFLGDVRHGRSVKNFYKTRREICVSERCKGTVVKYGQALPPKSLMDTPTGSSKRSAESTISEYTNFLKF